MHEEGGAPQDEGAQDDLADVLLRLRRADLAAVRHLDLEHAAQAAGFAAARLGAACGEIDRAARNVIAGAGFGPDYALPGLPHRTGHGIGLEVHEERYIVKGNASPLEAGMCFSIEPTICIYGEFGIRLEDCAHMTSEGARWFTTPCASTDDPFG